MKRLWLAAALLAAVFTATLLNSFHLKTFSTDLMSTLSLAEVNAEQGNWDKAEQLTDEARQRWQDKELYLYTLLRHADTDLIYTSFREVNEFIACQESGEYSAANARLIAQLELLYGMEQFTLKNLL